MQVSGVSADASRSTAELAQLAQLRAIDLKVRAHEQAGQKVSEHDRQAEPLEDGGEQRRHSDNQRQVGKRGRRPRTGGKEKRRRGHGRQRREHR